MSTRPGTISAQLIAAVAAHPGAKAPWLAKHIGSDNEGSCSALLCKLASNGLLRREGPTRPYRYYPAKPRAETRAETPGRPAAQGVSAASIGPSWAPIFPQRDDDDLDEEAAA